MYTLKDIIPILLFIFLIGATVYANLVYYSARIKGTHTKEDEEKLREEMKIW